MHIKSFAVAVVVVASWLWASSATGQTVSAGKPVRMIVPFAAGGPTDIMTRAFAPIFSAQLNQPVIVENRPGGGGNIAASYVASSSADGSTLLVAGQGILAINKPLYGKLTFEPERDFAWLGMLGSSPNVLVANPESAPAQTLQQLIEVARAQPGKISYGSNGIGSLSHLMTEVMAAHAKVQLLHVPYQGAAPQRTDLIGGRIGFSFIGISVALPLLRDGKLRPLAVSTVNRHPALPNIPTLIEAGFPMLDAPVWFGAVAPAQTPAATLTSLRAALAAAIASPAYAAEMEKQTTSVVRIDVDAANAMLARERKIWADAVRTTGATAN